MTMQCDRCGTEILADDPAMCFNNDIEDARTYLCEPCIEQIKEQWAYENRDTDFSESD